MTPKTVEWWRRYLAAPVTWRGRDLEEGVDCYSLIELVLPDVFGVAVERCPLFSPDEGRGLVEAARHINNRLANWRRVDWEEGAVCLWRLRARPVHVGICLTSPLFIHADWTVGSVQTASRRHPIWENRLVGCYLPNSV